MEIVLGGWCGGLFSQHVLPSEVEALQWLSWLAAGTRDRKVRRLSSQISEEACNSLRSPLEADGLGSDRELLGARARGGP